MNILVRGICFLLKYFGGGGGVLLNKILQITQLYSQVTLNLIFNKKDRWDSGKPRLPTNTFL